MIKFNKLFQYMAEHNINQAELSRLTGITPSTISRLRNNENVSLAFISKICTTLNLTLKDVLEYIPEN